MKIEITTFAESEDHIRKLRDQVFGIEQGVARDIDWDGKDMDCIQVLAMDDQGRAVGTGRLSSEGKVGRLAVLAEFRSQGIGGTMLEALIKEAQLQGIKQIYLHSQSHAIEFYLNHGFEPSGDEFMEAGIAHVKMSRAL